MAASPALADRLEQGDSGRHRHVQAADVPRHRDGSQEIAAFPHQPPQARPPRPRTRGRWAPVRSDLVVGQRGLPGQPDRPHARDPSVPRAPGRCSPPRRCAHGPAPRPRPWPPRPTGAADRRSCTTTPSHAGGVARCGGSRPGCGGPRSRRAPRSGAGRRRPPRGRPRCSRRRRPARPPRPGAPGLARGARAARAARDRRARPDSRARSRISRSRALSLSTNRTATRAACPQGLEHRVDSEDDHRRLPERVRRKPPHAHARSGIAPQARTPCSRARHRARSPAPPASSSSPSGSPVSTSRIGWNRRLPLLPGPLAHATGHRPERVAVEHRRRRATVRRPARGSPRATRCASARSASPSQRPVGGVVEQESETGRQLVELSTDAAAAGHRPGQERAIGRGGLGRATRRPAGTAPTAPRAAPAPPPSGSADSPTPASRRRRRRRCGPRPPVETRAPDHRAAAVPAPPQETTRGAPGS